MKRSSISWTGWRKVIRPLLTIKVEPQTTTQTRAIPWPIHWLFFTMTDLLFHIARCGRTEGPVTQGNVSINRAASKSLEELPAGQEVGESWQIKLPSAS